MALRPAYCLNGFTDHRLEDACRLLAGLGYRGVAITAGPPHLDAQAPATLPGGGPVVERARAVLAQCRLGCVLETGGRFWLDPARKHQPTLISADPEGRARRRLALLQAVDTAQALGAPVLHCWAGVCDPGVEPGAAWGWLVEGVQQLSAAAAAAGLVVGFEPEPGHLVESLADWERLRDAVDHPALKLTIDLGHIVCTEQPPWPQALARVAEHVVHVQADDMRPGVHQHLPFGEGEVPLAAMLGVLGAAGYQGQVAVELARHSHEAPLQAERSLTALRAAADQAGVELA